MYTGALKALVNYSRRAEVNTQTQRELRASDDGFQYAVIHVDIKPNLNY